MLKARWAVLALPEAEPRWKHCVWGSVSLRYPGLTWSHDLTDGRKERDECYRVREENSMLFKLHLELCVCACVQIGRASCRERV